MINDLLILINGPSATGKSTSLMNLQGRVLYLNCESGKKLPFKHNFHEEIIVDPYQVHDAFDAINPGGAMEGQFDTIVIDSLTFLMDMYETLYIVGAANTMAGWQNFQQYFKTLMQDKVARSKVNVIFTAHTSTELDAKEGEYVTKVPVKGALKGNGVEAYFSCIVSTKKASMKECLAAPSPFLNITKRDENLGFKYVFQTQLTKDTRGERIRGPIGLFDDDEVFMDNNAQALIDRLRAYYN